ncbi:hypothetical protein L6164_000777 [Bauhinia variegata]|uniref:Uncharacterized protein n=1 Tax=Bauhinia variegata TaxID=167791 RepID=A0ACB9Q746_BAUVA|nr:hypothetical protein L6164_000777 [Bauhinia variegata]
MDVLGNLHQRHQPLCSSVDHYCFPSLRRSISCLFLSPPTAQPSSPSIKASSSPSPLPSSSDPPRKNCQNPEAPSSQFSNPLFKISSFASVTAAAVFLFVGFSRNTLINEPISGPTVGPIQESIEEEESTVEELLLAHKPYHVKSIRLFKLKQKIPIVHSFNSKPDDQDWQVLKAQVFNCIEDLELVKIGFEEILERDTDGSRSYHDRILEYLEMVDECKCLLKDIKVAMDRCERDNDDRSYYMRFFKTVVYRIRILEEEMLGALKYFQELEQE